MAGDFDFFATIGADTSGFEAAFSKLDKTLGDWGVNLDKMSQKGSSFLKGFGVDTDVLAGKFGLTSAQLGVLATGAMAAAAAVAEVGKALIAVGEQFDKVNETLAKTTGATGGGLAALNTDFQDLLQLGVEQKIPDVAQAFADLNVKLGLSGKPLEDLTKLMSDFADVTNQSVTQAVEGSTDIINKWGLSLSDVPALLDQLTRASQKSGVSTGELSEILRKSGTQLQSFGLSMTDSIAMFSYFGKQGVNTTSVMMGLNSALAKFSKEGIDASVGFKQTVDKIQEAKNPTEAMATAVAVFGQRAGPELAKALMNGKGGIDEFKQALLEAGGAVRNTEAASDTLGDKTEVLKNKITGLFAPLGTSLIDTGKTIVETLTSIFDKLEPLLSPIVQIVSAVIGSISEVFGELVSGAQSVGGAFDTMYQISKTTLQGLADFVTVNLKNMVTVIKNAIGLIDALMRGDWAKAWMYTQLIVLQAVKVVLDSASGMVNGVVSVLNVMIGGMNTVLAPFGKKIPEMAQVAYSETLGLNAKIKALTDDLKKDTSVKLSDIGKGIQTSANTTAGLLGDNAKKLADAEADYQAKIAATQVQLASGAITKIEADKAQLSATNDFILALIKLGATNSKTYTDAVATQKKLATEIATTDKAITDQAEKQKQLSQAQKDYQATIAEVQQKFSSGVIKTSAEMHQKELDAVNALIGKLIQLGATDTRAYIDALAVQSALVTMMNTTDAAEAKLAENQKAREKAASDYQTTLASLDAQVKAGTLSRADANKEELKATDDLISKLAGLGDTDSEVYQNAIKNRKALADQAVIYAAALSEAEKQTKRDDAEKAYQQELSVTAAKLDAGMITQKQATQENLDAVNRFIDAMYGIGDTSSQVVTDAVAKQKELKDAIDETTRQTAVQNAEFEKQIEIDNARGATMNKQIADYKAAAEQYNNLARQLGLSTVSTQFNPHGGISISDIQVMTQQAIDSLQSITDTAVYDSDKRIASIEKEKGIFVKNSEDRLVLWSDVEKQIEDFDQQELDAFTKSNDAKRDQELKLAKARGATPAEILAINNKYNALLVAFERKQNDDRIALSNNYTQTVEDNIQKIQNAEFDAQTKIATARGEAFNKQIIDFKTAAEQYNRLVNASGNVASSAGFKKVSVQYDTSSGITTESVQLSTKQLEAAIKAYTNETVNAADQRIASAEKEKNIFVQAAEERMASWGDVVATIKDYDAQELAAFTEKNEAQRQQELLFARARGASEAEIFDINQKYDDQILAEKQKLTQDEIVLEGNYTQAVQENIVKRTQAEVEWSKKAIESSKQVMEKKGQYDKAYYDDAIQQIKNQEALEVEKAQKLGYNEEAIANIHKYYQNQITLTTQESVAAQVSAFNTLLSNVASIFSAIGGDGAQALSKIASLVESTVTAASTNFADIGADISMVVNAIGVAGEASAEKFSALQQKLTDVVDILLKALSPITNVVFDVLIKVLGELEPILNMINNLTTSLQPLFNVIVTLVSIVTDVLTSVLVPIFDALQPVFDLIGSFASMIGEILDALKPFLEIGLKIVIAVLQPLTFILPLVLQVLTPIFNMIKKIMDWLSNGLSGVIKWIANLLGIKYATNDVADATDTAADATESYTDKLNDANKKLKENRDLFKETTFNAEKYGGVLGKVLTALEKFFKNTDAYKAELIKLKDAASSFYESLQNVGADIASKLVENFEQGLTEADFMTSMKEYITKLVIESAVYTDTMMSKIAAIGTAIATAIANGASEADIAAIQAQLRALYQEASQTMGTASEIVNTAFSGYASGTNYSTAGIHLVGEYGAELVKLPQGARVFNHSETRNISPINEPVTNNIVFNSPKELSPYEMRRALLWQQRRMAFEGNL